MPRRSSAAATIPAKSVVAAAAPVAPAIAGTADDPSNVLAFAAALESALADVVIVGGKGGAGQQQSEGGAGQQQQSESATAAPDQLAPPVVAVNADLEDTAASEPAPHETVAGKTTSESAVPSQGSNKASSKSSKQHSREISISNEAELAVAAQTEVLTAGVAAPTDQAATAKRGWNKLRVAVKANAGHVVDKSLLTNPSALPNSSAGVHSSLSSDSRDSSSGWSKPNSIAPTPRAAVKVPPGIGPVYIPESARPHQPTLRRSSSAIMKDESNKDRQVGPADFTNPPMYMSPLVHSSHSAINMIYVKSYATTTTMPNGAAVPPVVTSNSSVAPLRRGSTIAGVARPQAGTFQRVGEYGSEAFTAPPPPPQIASATASPRQSNHVGNSSSNSNNNINATPERRASGSSSSQPSPPLMYQQQHLLQQQEKQQATLPRLDVLQQLGPPQKSSVNQLSNLAPMGMLLKQQQQQQNNNVLTSSSPLKQNVVAYNNHINSLDTLFDPVVEQNQQPSSNEQPPVLNIESSKQISQKFRAHVDSLGNLFDDNIEQKQMPAASNKNKISQKFNEHLSSLDSLFDRLVDEEEEEKILFPAAGVELTSSYGADSAVLPSLEGGSRGSNIQQPQHILGTTGPAVAPLGAEALQILRLQQAQNVFGLYTGENNVVASVPSLPSDSSGDGPVAGGAARPAMRATSLSLDTSTLLSHEAATVQQQQPIPPLQQSPGEVNASSILALQRAQSVFFSQPFDSGGGGAAAVQNPPGSARPLNTLAQLGSYASQPRTSLSLSAKSGASSSGGGGRTLSDLIDRLNESVAAGAGAALPSVPMIDTSWSPPQHQQLTLDTSSPGTAPGSFAQSNQSANNGASDLDAFMSTRFGGPSASRDQEDVSFAPAVVPLAPSSDSIEEVVRPAGLARTNSFSLGSRQGSLSGSGGLVRTTSFTMGSGGPGSQSPGSIGSRKFNSSAIQRAVEASKAAAAVSSMTPSMIGSPSGNST